MAEDVTAVRFAVELATPAAIWTSEASVSRASGEVAWHVWQGPGEPPEWLRHYLRSLLRSAWRGHAEQGWPRRLTRWREAPDPEAP